MVKITGLYGSQFATNKANRSGSTVNSQPVDKAAIAEAPAAWAPQTRRVKDPNAADWKALDAAGRVLLPSTLSHGSLAANTWRNAVLLSTVSRRSTLPGGFSWLRY